MATLLKHDGGINREGDMGGAELGREGIEREAMSLE